MKNKQQKKLNKYKLLFFHMVSNNISEFYSMKYNPYYSYYPNSSNGNGNKYNGSNTNSNFIGKNKIDNNLKIDLNEFICHQPKEYSEEDSYTDLILFISTIFNTALADDRAYEKELKRINKKEHNKLLPPELLLPENLNPLYASIILYHFLI